MASVQREVNKDKQQEQAPRDVNLPAQLSAADSALLVRVVEEQTQPNEDLQRAAQRYRQRHS